MRKVNSKYVDGLVSKVLKETLEERADELMSKIKTNVNELGGMDSDHPKFGKMNFSKMSPEEIEDMMNNYVDDDSDDNDWSEIDTEDNHEGNWIHPLGEDEMEEGFDDPFIYNARGGKDYSSKEFKRIPKGAGIDMKNYRDDSVTPSRFIGNKLNDIDDLFKKHFGDNNGDDDDFNFDYGKGDDDIMFEMEEKLCEQCGGKLTEGECTECGTSYSSMEEGIHDVEDLDDDNEFDYVEEESETGIKDYSIKGESNPEGCKAIMDTIKKYGETEVEREALERYKCDSMKKMETKESLRGRQRVLDKNKNNKIDAEDFKLLRSKKTETKESSKPDFLDLDKDGDKKEPMKKASKDKKSIKESIRLTEDELVELIENIIKEEQKLLNKGGTPKGLSKYKEVHAKDGKENDEYLKSVATKMKEYLKDGSKGEYSESPKHHPKGNGQLEKMKAKKYTMSNDGEEFLDDYMRPGMENLDFDEIHPNEEWMENTIEGSSKTGNSNEYANSEKTDVNKNINKKRKENKFAKAKKMAYKKSAQPVISDKTGEESGNGLNIKLESETKKDNLLNEEFNKIQKLMSYDRKTQ